MYEMTVSTPSAAKLSSVPTATATKCMVMFKSATKVKCQSYSKEKASHSHRAKHLSNADKSETDASALQGHLYKK